MTRHIVMFSGGIGSWMAARRVAERHGTDDLALLFCDTNMEDPDLYRFLDQAAANVGAPLIRIADGRTPWQVFRDERFLGNHRRDPCSKILKRQLADRYLTRYDPMATVIYVGIDWTEEHRFIRLRDRRRPWRYEAPLCEPPYPTKPQMFEALRAQGIAVPRLYRLGFPHNNCGGQCCKAGQAQWALLYRTLPARYAEAEREEQSMRGFLGKDVAMLTDRRGGQRRPLTLREFRQRLQADPDNHDRHAWGGCGCFLDRPEEAPAP